MTSRRRRSLIDTRKFNAMSIAIISTAAFYMGAAQAQMAAPSSKTRRRP